MHPTDIDWTTWAPTDVATLLFIRRRHELLLIRKKRGLGAGKINAPGGRVEPGETLEQAAIREVQEEVLVTPRDARHRGELRFQFVDGYSLHCHVFMANDFTGEPGETDEALPMWVPIAELPYDEMWADDAVWLPKMLAGYTFSATSTFDGDRMLGLDLTLDDPAAALFARLDALGVAHTTHQHAPVFTVDQAKAVRRDDGGVHLKNLFLRNRKGAMWLVSLPEDQPVDLKALGAQLGAGRVSFASPQRLTTYLGVEPGSVTPFAALHDTQHKVSVAVAASVLSAPIVHCHPLTCDRTTAVSGPDLRRFLDDIGHPPTPL